MRRARRSRRPGKLRVRQGLRASCFYRLSKRVLFGAEVPNSTATLFRLPAYGVRERKEEGIGPIPGHAQIFLRYELQPIVETRMNFLGSELRMEDRVFLNRPAFLEPELRELRHFGSLVETALVV